MICPHCLKPIPPELILRERQSELAKRPRKPADGRTKYPRPGAIGLVRNPKGRKPKADGQPSETEHHPNAQDQSAR